MSDYTGTTTVAVDPAAAFGHPSEVSNLAGAFSRAGTRCLRR